MQINKHLFSKKMQVFLRRFVWLVRYMFFAHVNVYVCNFSKSKLKTKNCTKPCKMCNFKNRSFSFVGKPTVMYTHATQRRRYLFAIIRSIVNIVLLAYAPCIPFEGGPISGRRHPPPPVWRHLSGRATLVQIFLFFIFGLVSCFNNRSLCFTHVSIFATMAFFGRFRALCCVF